MTEDRSSKSSFNGQDGTQPPRILANGKKVRIVDSENYSEIAVNKNEDLTVKNFDIDDLFRVRYNRHWGPRFAGIGGGLPKVKTFPESVIPLQGILFDNTIEKHETEEGELFEPTTQQFKLFSRKRFFKLGANNIQRREYNKNAWKAFITDKPFDIPIKKLPILRSIDSVPVKTRTVRIGRTENTALNFNAVLSWSFFNSKKVSVFREEDGRIIPLFEDVEFDSLEGDNAQRREILRRASKRRSKRRPSSRTETGIDPRELQRQRENDRRLASIRRGELRTTLGGLQRQIVPEAQPTSVSNNSIVVPIQGFQTFRFVAENESGTTMVRVRIHGRIHNGRLILTQDEPIIVEKEKSLPPPEVPPDQKIDIIPTFDEENVFFDHTFDLNIPFEKKVLDKVNAPIGSLFADVQPNYNFFIDNYEQTIGSASTPETLLPNLYAFLTELRNENTDEKNTIFRQHITLSDTIPDAFVDITNNKGEKIGEKDKGQYFDKYARSFGELMRLKPNKEEELIRKFTNLVTPISDVDLFKEFNEKRELFPMFFDISFSTDKTTQFAEILKDSQLSNLLVRDIIEQNISTITKSFQVTTATQQQEGQIKKTKSKKLVDHIKQRRKRRFSPEELRKTTTPQGTSESFSEEKNLETWDITEWLKQLTNNPLEAFSGLDDGVFLGTYGNETKLAINSQFDFYKNLLVIIFAGKIKKLVEREMRTFEEIMEGKLAYSETAFYKIEKRDATTNEIIQNFFLPNSNEIDILRFIDTQVKYNKQYTYEIFAYQFVIGNKYNYKIKDVTEDNATIEVNNMPSIQLVKVSYHEFTGRIMDSPPIFPDVSVIPFRAVNNRIKFNLNGNVGEYMLDPVLIEPEDEDIIRRLREAQMITEEQFLRYAGDDRVSAFEIFRIDRKPRKFQDFSGNRLALVETDISSLTVQAATAGSFIDNIMPNKKYYYIFRTIDNHGHISNPTPIYELEIVDNSGIIFPIVKTVEFDMGEDTKVCAKTARKYIQIIPTFQQTLLNEEKSGLVVGGERVSSIVDRENFHLGVADEQIWKKNFKIRLISRKTGKKLDLNVDFDHKNVRKVDNGGKILNEGTKN